jgi:hypothetical protein
MPTTVPMALTRQRVVLQVNRAEMMLIESKAKEAGMTVTNYFRSLAGLPLLTAGRATRAQMEEEQDRAWEILKSMGIRPHAVLPLRRIQAGDYR